VDQNRRASPEGDHSSPGSLVIPAAGQRTCSASSGLALERCPEAIEKLTELMRSAKSERAQADAASKILDRGCGKPTQPADGRLDVTYHVRDQPMPLDEWRRTFTDE
jgi:hypothetical protein